MHEFSETDAHVSCEMKHLCGFWMATVPKVKTGKLNRSTYQFRLCGANVLVGVAHFLEGSSVGGAFTNGVALSSHAHTKGLDGQALVLVIALDTLA